MTMMDVPDDWGVGSSSLTKNTDDDDDDDGKEEGWLTKPSEKVALPKKKKKKTTPGGGGVDVAAPRASGRALGRRRRAKEKRKRLAMMKKTHQSRDAGGGGSPEDDEEDEEECDDDERNGIEGEKNNPASSSSSPPPPPTRRSNVAKHDATMTEKQKRKAEKNRARKLRREWKRKKEMEEKKDDLGSRSDEEKENETKKTKQPDDEERKEMKRLAKDYVTEKAKKRAKATTTAEEDGGGRNSRSSEEDRAPVHQPVKQKKLSLIDKMRAKLSGGHFRMLNEQLYTTKGDEALHLVQQNPGVFSAYHEGFREQVKKWPKNPVHKCFEWLQHKPYDTVVADFGCGDAELAKLIGKSKKKVYSLDLETPSHAPFVIACNMAKTPLESNSIDVAVFSLSLMGTDYYKFIEEASRVLKVKGTLWIAEVKSRFDGKNGTASISSFISSLKNAGFDVNPKKVDEKDKMFFALEAVKTKNTGASSNDDGGVDDGKTKKKKMKKSAPVDWPTLKACEYKKR